MFVDLEKIRGFGGNLAALTISRAVLSCAVDFDLEYCLQRVNAD